MQIDAQEFLKLAEKAHGIATFDIESTGLNCDYNSIIVISIKPFMESPKSFVVNQPGNDKGVVASARDMLHEYPVWVSYYGRRFDYRMIQGRLLKHHLAPLQRHHHIDLYQVLKSGVNTSRRSMAHYSHWLETDEQKLTLSPDVWAKVIANPEVWLPKLKNRCEADVKETEGLYRRSRQLIREVIKQN